jgi:hypothetical protein
MTIDEFLDSPEFARLVDEDLRKTAEAWVESYCQSVKASQILALRALHTSAGSSGLKEHAGHQSEKDTNAANKAFWGHVAAWFDREHPHEHSPGEALGEALERQGLFEAEDESLGKSEKRKIRKANRDMVAKALERALPAFVEHLVCHYRYRVGDGR